jgi:flagellin
MHLSPAMGLSIQTNVTSLIAQENLRTNTAFQSNTIQQLTSGYRINSSGDDAAGLAVANQYRSTTAQLTQGVLNANNGVSVFQTIDGGLSNIAQILDRLNTLATESASGTFNGNRSTINNEYQTLVGEINRQAANVGLDTGGIYNSSLSIFIGGGSNQGNSQVNINLSGANNAVDSSALSLTGTSVGGGGTALTGNTVNLNNTAVVFVAGGSQTFTFNIAGPSGAATTVAATISGGTSGLSGEQVISSLNQQLQASGITASIGSNGGLQFSGSAAFTLGALPAATAGNAVATAGATVNTNTGFSNINVAFTAGQTGTETLTFQNAGSTYNVSLNTAESASTATAVAAINTQLQGSGITAVVGANGTDIGIQSQNSFSIDETTLGTGGGLFTALGAQSVASPAANATNTGNAESSLVAIQSAVTKLGLVQGKVGAGENLLSDAVNLAQSQITNFSAAQSRIRDADIATEAANLTKSQVLDQSSIAALAQANSAPQQLLTLLKQG